MSLNDDIDGADPRTLKRDRSTGFILLLMFLTICAAVYYGLGQAQRRAVDEETVQMQVAQVLQFPAVARAGVTRLQAAGVPLHRIDFGTDATGSRALFHKKGGGVRYQVPPRGLAEEGARWRFKSVTEAGEGWFIAGIGSDGKNGKDVFAYLAGLPRSGCERINRALGLPGLPKIEAVAVDLATAGTADSTAGLNPWTFAAHGLPQDDSGRDVSPHAACVQNGTGGIYVFYYVLAAQ